MAETGHDGAILDTCLRGGGLISSERFGHYLYNGHGDVVQLSDGTGSVTRDYDFDAFGVQANLATGTAHGSQQGDEPGSGPQTGNGPVDEEDLNPWRYTGEYFDTETGNVYLRNRYYNPEQGRFLNEDPIRDGLNWYAYANNNPVMFWDPTGLAYEMLTEWLKSLTDFSHTVKYYEDTKSAIVELNKGKSTTVISGYGRITVKYTVGVEGTFIGMDGKMYVDTTSNNSSSRALWNYIDPPLEYTPVKDAVVLGLGIAGAAKGGVAVARVLSDSINQVSTIPTVVAPDRQKLYSETQRHIFSYEHVEKGIMKLGSSQVDIFNKITDIANQYSDKMGGWFK